MHGQTQGGTGSDRPPNLPKNWGLQLAKLKTRVVQPVAPIKDTNIQYKLKKIFCNFQSFKTAK